MNAVVRPENAALCLVLLVSTGFATFACGPKEGRDEVVGVSDRSRGNAGSKEPEGSPPRDGSTVLPADYRKTFKKMNDARFVSTGHASGRWEVDVYANDLGAGALSSRTREVPVGAIVVEEHFEKTSGGDESTAGSVAGPVMLMEKREKGFAPEHGDWRWVTVGASGHVVADGVVEACAGCHDDAPADGLFPITSSKRP